MKYTKVNHTGPTSHSASIIVEYALVAGGEVAAAVGIRE